MGPDWGDGDYSRTAAQLAPVAGELIVFAGIGPGQRVLDVACGTGNAALAAARLGARVTGVDPAKGLLAQARQRAATEGIEATFLAGSAEDLPVEDAAFDAVVSVFGAVFAPDAERTVRELLRAARPGGVVALTSWVSDGPVQDASRLLKQALPGGTTAPNLWHDPGWVADLLAAVGADDVTIERRDHVFRGDSPEAWFADVEEHHPVWRWARRRVPADRWERLRLDSVAALQAGNEDPAAFVATEGWLAVRCRR